MCIIYCTASQFVWYLTSDNQIMSHTEFEVDITSPYICEQRQEKSKYLQIQFIKGFNILIFEEKKIFG